MRRWAMRLVGAVALTAVVGCHGAPRAETRGQALIGRSLATDSRTITRLEHRAGPVDGSELAWYEFRNDVLPAVEAGYEGPVVEFNATLTRDRQSFHNGRVRDNYQQRTYRSRLQGVVR